MFTRFVCFLRWGLRALVILIWTLCAGTALQTTVIRAADPTPTATVELSIPDSVPIRYGDTREGALTPSVPQLFYSFSAAQGDVISLQMTVTSGRLTPFVILLDGRAANVVRVGTTQSPDDQVAMIRMVITSSGDYLIKCADSPANELFQSGAFRLQLALENPTPTPSSAIIAPILMPLRPEVSGVLDAESKTRLFAFSGVQDAALRATVSTTGNLQLGLYVYDQDFAKRHAAVELGGSLATTLPDTGRYFLAAVWLNGAGSFTLNVDMPTPLASNVLITRTNLLPGQAIEASLADQPARSYQFAITATTRWRANLISTNPAKPPTIIVCDPQYRQVSAARGSTPEITLEQPGVYILIVLRADGLTAPDTSGSYSLMADGTIIAGAIPAFTPFVTFTPITFTPLPTRTQQVFQTATPLPPRRITYGTALTDTLSNIISLRYYLFDGILADRVTIRAGRVNGTLDPALYLYAVSPDGTTVIATDDDSAGAPDALIDAFDLPQTGSYLIVVAQSPKGPAGAGDFALTLQK